MTTTTPTRLELAAWCGELWDLLDSVQQDQFVESAIDIYQRYEDQSERDVALAATLSYLTGELSVEEAGTRRVATRAAERAAFIEAIQVGVLAVRYDGEKQAPTAERLGVDRMSLRAGLGVRPTYQRKRKTTSS